MATDLQIDPEQQALTADGGSNGILTVASTSGLRKGARIFLRADDLDSLELVIDKVIDATHIAVRDPNVTGAVRKDCSSYTMVLNAKLFQPAQSDFYASQWIRF